MAQKEIRKAFVSAVKQTAIQLIHLIFFFEFWYLNIYKGLYSNNSTILREYSNTRKY